MCGSSVGKNNTVNSDGEICYKVKLAKITNENGTTKVNTTVAASRTVDKRPTMSLADANDEYGEKIKKPLLARENLESFEPDQVVSSIQMRCTP